MLFFDTGGDTQAKLKSKQLQPFKPCWHNANDTPQGITKVNKVVYLDNMLQVLFLTNLSKACCWPCLLSTVPPI